MDDGSAIVPKTPVVEREGEPVAPPALDMSDPRDVATLRRALAEGWKISIERLEAYLKRLDAVMRATQDERVIVAGAGVGVAALRAHTDAIKAMLGQRELHLHNHNELHVHGRELPEELSVEELRKLAALAEGQGQGHGQPGQGDPGSAPKRPDADPLHDRPDGC